jgi:outer membrane protein
MSFKNAALNLVLLAVAAGTAANAQEGTVLDLRLDDVVERALKNNVDIAVQRFQPEAAAENVRQARGAYDPVFTSTVTDSSIAQPATITYQGKLIGKQALFNFGLAQAISTGAQLNVTFNNNRQSSDNTTQIYNPQYSSTLSVGLTQPLLRGLRIDNQRYQLRVAKKNREISDVQFHQTVAATVANVKQLYYELIYAIDNLEAQRKSLALAGKLLDENRIKVKVGTLAPLDVVQAESEAASREADVIVAEAAVTQAEDNLKGQIFPRHETEMWALHIHPTDRPTAEAKTIDVDAAITTALEKRTDVVAARKNIQILDLGLRLSRNSLLPSVDLVASYSATGSGGPKPLLDSTTGAPIGVIPGGYGDATHQVFARDFPSWTVGANVSFPLFNRAASATAARSRISRDQAVASLRRLELQVAAEVRAAARAVETNYKRVEATGAARVLATRSLDAEDKKFTAGMSTNYLVTQKQRDLALAEVLELRALADYRTSVIVFERALEAAGSSVSFVASTSSGSSSGQ